MAKLLRASLAGPARHPWMASSYFACGDLVREKDGRHVGRVEYLEGPMVRVRWLDSGWLSEFNFSDLERAWGE